METLDLNINNYKLDDLLKLFHLNYDFDENDLKFAKKIVLKTHPDKSKLDPKIFQFYTKAFNIVNDIYLFKNKMEKKVENKIEKYEVVLNDDKEKKMLLDNFFTKNSDLVQNSGNFNKWFNEEFTKVYINENEKGYEEWLRSNENEEPMTSFSESELENRKKKLQGVIVYKGFEELYAPTNVGGSLLGDPSEINDYSSGDVFSKFKFQDLKKAYEESIIPVTQSDYDNMPKYKSVNDYKQVRSVPIPIPTKEESDRILKSKEQDLETTGTKNAYYYSKQMEEYQKRNQQFISNLARISY
jgi:hypothetical protein